jgi:hypothetical protein
MIDAVRLRGQREAGDMSASPVDKEECLYSEAGPALLCFA